MLVLSRKVGQELVIGDNIRITVNRIGGSRVTLGIVAPDDVRIVRSELEQIVRSFEDEPGAGESAEAEAALEIGTRVRRPDVPGSIGTPDEIDGAAGVVAARGASESSGVGRGAAGDGVPSGEVGTAAPAPFAASSVPHRSSRILSHRRNPVTRNGAQFRDRRDLEATEARQRLSPERPLEVERSPNPPMENGTPLRSGEPVRPSEIGPVERAGTDANLNRTVRVIGGCSANDDLGRSIQ